MPTTKKKKAAPKKSAAKKSAPAKRVKQKKMKPVPNNVISFAELYELRRKRLAEAQQQSWKDGTTGTSVTIQNEGPKTPASGRSVRNGRTNGSGSRHH